MQPFLIWGCPVLHHNAMTTTRLHVREEAGAKPRGLMAEFCKTTLSPLYLRALEHFPSSYPLPIAWTQTHIVFIPKSPNPEVVSSFCPIAMTNVSYRILA